MTLENAKLCGVNRFFLDFYAGVSFRRQTLVNISQNLSEVRKRQN